MAQIAMQALCHTIHVKSFFGEPAIGTAQQGILLLTDVTLVNAVAKNCSWQKASDDLLHWRAREPKVVSSRLEAPVTDETILLF